MPTFRYCAKKGPEDTIEGTIEAETRDEAVEKISQSGYFPTSVEDVSAGPNPSHPSPSPGRIRSRDITTVSRQLSSLLRSGVPLLRGLGVISEQAENENLKGMLERISNEIREGASFSSALAAYPKVFSSLYLAIVRAGEASGTMEEALSRVADYRGKQEEMISRVRMALVYPAFMAVAGAAATTFMLVFVMPRLSVIFDTIGQELPIPTKIVLAVSTGFLDHWVWVLSGLALVILAAWHGGGIQRAVLDRIKLRLPILGKFFLKVELARFSRTMEILVRSGIPILAAIKTASSVFGNEVIRAECNRTYGELERGGSFGQSLGSSKLFPPYMSSLVIVGEESGRLDESLAEVANSYERDTDEAVATSTALLEPLMILIVGSVIGFMVIAMLLPIFQIDMMAGM